MPESRALHIGQQKHQPWCRIFHQPAMTTECWCDSQIAATAYKLGLAEGMGMAAAQKYVHSPEPEPVTVNALPSAAWSDDDE